MRSSDGNQQHRNRGLTSPLAQLPRFFARSRSRPRTAGFTLVELAIAMSILGLMIGLGLQPMRERLRSEDFREAREVLRQASDAVVAYGMSRGVEPRELRAFGGLHRIPGGRPYLPCPDVDGDGLEDRRAGGAVANPLAATALDSTAADAANGSCRFYKGMLPWRTIGGPEADPWGTHLTYRVDPNFANSALGFDGSTRAETPDTLAWLGGASPTLAYRPRDGLNGRDAPSVICLTYDCLVSRPGVRSVFGAADSVEEQSFLHDLKIGLAALEPLNLMADSGRIYLNDAARMREDFVDAPVFVIVSHGPNGFGGVRADSGRCAPMDDDDDPNELQNAFYSFIFVDQHPLTSDAGCYTRQVVPPEPAGGSYLDEAVFVDRPPTPGSILSAGARTMDDVLVWMSANELAHRLARGREPPLPLPFLREAQ